MADISKCQNKSCKLSSSCWRFLAPANVFQNYIVSPEEDCEQNEYEYYLK